MNAMWVELTVGIRSSRVGSEPAALAVRAAFAFCCAAADVAALLETARSARVTCKRRISAVPVKSVALQGTAPWMARPERYCNSSSCLEYDADRCYSQVRALAGPSASTARAPSPATYE